MPTFERLLVSLIPIPNNVLILQKAKLTFEHKNNSEQ